jgi:hypothetical protein
VNTFLGRQTPHEQYRQRILYMVLAVIARIEPLYLNAVENCFAYRTTSRKSAPNLSSNIFTDTKNQGRTLNAALNKLKRELRKPLTVHMQNNTGPGIQNFNQW